MQTSAYIICVIYYIHIIYIFDFLYMLFYPTISKRSMMLFEQNIEKMRLSYAVRPLALRARTWSEKRMMVR